MWYTKFDLINREGRIKCPNCEKEFSEQMFYSLDPILCNNCSSKILFLRTLRFIYVINFDKSPELFKVMHKHLISQTLKKGMTELKEVIKLFDGEIV
jgi:DNA-directed RNA polymerase subunit RPC12/RpoP